MSNCPCSEFRRFKDEDISIVMEYLKKSKYIESNHNIVNMIMWRFYFPLWICVQKEYLCLIGKHKNKWFMYMPLCEERYFKQAVLCTKQYFENAKIPFVMSCFTYHQAHMVKEVIPDMQIIEDRDGFDYIYSIDQLKTLSGKKLQKKRNHLNAFYKEYENRYMYEKISKANISECIEFLQQWKSDEEDAMLQEEKKGIKEVFRLWDVLPCEGGLLRIDGVVKAFVISSPLFDKVVQVNVEKADIAIRGCYQAIMVEHIKACLSHYEYVNREDDMGLDSLRQAKMAYNPCSFVSKYRLQKEVFYD